MTMPEWTAWVTSRTKAQEVDGALARVVGRQVAAVRYLDLDDFTDEPYEWLADAHHNIGQGLEIDFDDGTTLSVCWEQNGFHEGLGVRFEKLMPGHVLDAKIHDLTGCWNEWGLRRLEVASTYWTKSWHNDSLLLSAVEFGDGDHAVLLCLSASLDVLVWPNPGVHRRSILLAGCELVTR